MLLLNKDTVVDILLDHLLMPNSTSLEALLDLTRCGVSVCGLRLCGLGELWSVFWMPCYV